MYLTSLVRLTIPRTLKSSNEFLIACLEYGSIILDPDYQREIVWDEHRASMLICSILSMSTYHIL